MNSSFTKKNLSNELNQIIIIVIWWTLNNNTKKKHNPCLQLSTDSDSSVVMFILDNIVYVIFCSENISFQGTVVQLYCYLQSP